MTTSTIEEESTSPLLVTIEQPDTVKYNTFNNGTTQVRTGGLGLVMGVFIPCILNIFGAILFLRLGKITGEVRVIMQASKNCRQAFQSLFYYL
jgi:hypothetical protein